jgi:hypothetical protein
MLLKTPYKNMLSFTTVVIFIKLVIGSPHFCLYTFREKNYTSKTHEKMFSFNRGVPCLKD